MASQEEIFKQITEIFVELFEIEAADVNLDSRLYDDLDIDSIDAVDLMVKLKEITGKRVDPDDFKDVTTVADCVDAMSELYASTSV